MNVNFLIVTLILIAVSAAMVLIILVQRPAGGGLSGAFGGAGAGGSETVFGGRVGDALTWATVVIFAVYLIVAVSLNMMESEAQPTQGEAASITAPEDGDGSGGAAPGPSGTGTGGQPATQPGTSGQQSPGDISPLDNLPNQPPGGTGSSPNRNETGGPSGP